MRKKRNIRRWTLWWLVIALLALTAIFSAEEIGKKVGLMIGKSKTEDPFRFGQVSNIPKRHRAKRGGELPVLTTTPPKPRASNPVTKTDLKNNPDWKTRYKAGTEHDTVFVQEAILKGDLVELPPGDYLINQPIRFHSNLKLKGSGARLIGSGAFKGKAIEIRGMEDLSIIGLTFWDLKLSLIDSRQVLLQNLNFVVQNSSGDDSPQIRAVGIRDGLEVIESNFIRSPKAPGIGISVERSRAIEVRYSSFMGAYETALQAIGSCKEIATCNLGTKTEPKYNDRFRNLNVLFRNNKLHRKDSGQKAGSGISISGAKGAILKQNRIHGWPLRSASACIRISNGEDISVQENFCSGPLRVIHEQIHPRFLRNVRVVQNTVKVKQSTLPQGWERKYKNWLPGSPQRAATEFAGIVVERNFEEVLEAPKFMESGIEVANNEAVNGLIRVSGIRKDAMNIQGNKASLCRGWFAEVADSKNTCTVQE